IREGLALLTWEQDSFMYADSYDEATQRYRGLRQQNVSITQSDAPGLLVKPDVARKQWQAESATAPTYEPSERISGGGNATAPPGKASITSSTAGHTAEPPKLRRYHGTVTLDATRVGRDASRIANEVIAHLAGLVGAQVKVTLEIEAIIPDGASDHVVRTVTE